MQIFCLETKKSICLNIDRVTLAKLEYLVEMEDQEKMAPLDTKVKMLLFQRSFLEEMQDGMATGKPRSSCNNQMYCA
jgi:hypothetical protein